MSRTSLIRVNHPMSVDTAKPDPSGNISKLLEGRYKTGTLVWAKFGRKFHIGFVVTSLCPWYARKCEKNHIILWLTGQISEIEDSPKKIVDFLLMLKQPLAALKPKEFEKHYLSNAFKLVMPYFKCNLTKLPVTILEASYIVKHQLGSNENAPPTVVTMDDETIRKLQNIAKKKFVNQMTGPELEEFIFPENLRDCHFLCVGCRDYQQHDIEANHPIVENGILCKYCKFRLAELNMPNHLKNFHCIICGWETQKNCAKCQSPICSTCWKFWGLDLQNSSLLEGPHCFICKPNMWKLQPKKNLPLQNDLETDVANLSSEPDTGIRVLSLFDGISTGLIALNELGIALKKYLSSEIDETALTVSNHHHSGKIVQLGDVKNITSKQINVFTPIKLLLGGSPCNDLSSVNPSKKGLSDVGGTGPLFFEYYRILKEMQSRQGENSFYFLYENVNSMRAEERATITRFLGVEPVLIDAKFFTSMQRPRLYWTNIKNAHQLSSENLQKIGKIGEPLQSHLLQNLNRVALVETTKTVTTNSNSLFRGSKQNQPQVIMNGRRSKVVPAEMETMFGLPPHYTDVGLTHTERQKVIGKSWCVQVIKAILSPLAAEFEQAPAPTFSEK